MGFENRLAVGILSACACARAGPARAPQQHPDYAARVEAVRSARALCGGDKSCEARAEAHLVRQRERSQVPGPGSAPASTREGASGWHCFSAVGHRGGFGYCERSLGDCLETMNASMARGITVDEPCVRREEASCLAVFRDDEAVLFCAPSPPACKAMSEVLANRDDVSEMEPCETVP